MIEITRKKQINSLKSISEELEDLRATLDVMIIDLTTKKFEYSYPDVVYYSFDEVLEMLAKNRKEVENMLGCYERAIDKM